MALKKPKVQGGKRGGREKQQQVGKPIRGDDTDEDHQDGGDDDDDEVRHSARTATTILVRLLIEVHPSAPFKSSRFREGIEVPKRTCGTVSSERPCSRSH